MMGKTLMASCGSLAAIGLAALFAFDTGAAVAADATHPTVVELYQSQGCSSCPPAIANVNALADDPGVLPLMFAVTYWDKLGWKDTFDDPKYTARQWDYAHAARRGSVATPQVVINGNGVVVGGNRAVLNRAIAKFDRGNGGPSIARAGDTVTIGAAATPRPATVWLVRYDPRTLDVAVRAGENSGKTIAHRNVVRALTALGSWKGKSTSFTLPAAADTHYRSAILVQRGKGGWIIAADRI